MQKLVTYDGKEINRIRIPRTQSLLPRAEPVYPNAARTQGIEGKVVVAVVIDRQGDITEMKIESGDSVLAESVVESVRTWKYQPIKLNGIPVEVLTRVEVTFTLPDSVAVA